MFYGWIIVTLAFVSMFVVTGTLIQSFPAFLLPLSEDFRIGRAEASLPSVVITAASVVTLPVIGRLVGIYPIRNVMLAGAAALALGFAGISQATSWWAVLALYGVVGSLALSAMGICCNTLVVNWFERRRAMALGIALLGMSISGVVLLPVATWAIDAWGWRMTYLGFGCGAVALMPLIARLAVSRPSDMGLAPDGDDAAASRVSPEEHDEPLKSTRELLSSSSLWMISAACGLVFFGATGVMNHGIAFATDRGIESMRAAALISAIFVGSASGKLVFGWLADRLGERRAFGVALVFCGLGLTGFITLMSYSALSVAAVIFGLGIGGVMPLQAALLARCFGARNFAPAMGLIGPLMLPFQVSGPPLAGGIFDTRGSYDLALWIFVGAIAASAVALSLIRLPKVEAPAVSAVSANAEVDPA